MLYRVTRDVTRAAARSGGQRKPAAPKPAPAMTGAAWVLLVTFIIVAAGIAELFENHWGVSRGKAFLMAFTVTVLITAVIAGICSGLRGSKSSAATQIRAAHAEQERAKRDRARQARTGLLAEMEAADLEARAWKDAHPEMFGENSNERTPR